MKSSELVTIFLKPACLLNHVTKSDLIVEVNMKDHKEDKADALLSLHTDAFPNLVHTTPLALAHPPPTPHSSFP